MSMTVQAVYTNGVRRPTEPLSLTEGQRVEVTIATADSASSPISEAELIQRIQACTSYQEWLALTKLLPADDGGYDIVKALDENRRWSGEGSILPTKECQP